MTTLARDFRLALRGMAKSPGFAAIAVLAFALGIGANTAIFSAVNAVLLRPLGYADAERLVMIEQAGPRPVSPATFLDWKAQTRSFSGMIAAEAWGGSVRGTTRPEPLIGLRVSGETFSFLGVAPMMGRGFTAEEDAPGGPAVVVIAHSLWKRSFGGAADIVGRKIEIGGEPYTVVGVMPEGFQFAPVWVTRAEVWRPLQIGGVAGDRDGSRLRVFARLREGVTEERARAEMVAITDRLGRQYPESDARNGVSMVALRERVVGSVQTMLLVLLGTVGFVLFLACANVANLMLARAAGKRREMAVRRALGATRWQMARQSMTEGAALAMCGGGLGVALAFAGVRALQAVLPPGAMPRQQELGVDGMALAFTAGLSVLIGVLAGVFPALQWAGADVNEGLKEGGRGGSEGRRGHRMRSGLVAVEAALAFVLLMGAGLMLRSVGRMLTLDAGFEAKGLLTMEVSVAGTRQAAPEMRANYYRQVMERVAAVPGVRRVSAVNHSPITGDVWGTRFRIVGQPEPRPGEAPGAVYRVAWPGYFATLGARMVRGREFTGRDTMDAPRVVVINQAAERKYWAGEDAVGRRVASQGQTWTVVGVVRDLRQGSWLNAPEAEMYFPVLQNEEYLVRGARHYQALSLLVRSAGGDAGALAGAVRLAIEGVDSNVLVSGVTTMEDAVDQQLWRQRLTLLLLGAFGVVALALAVTGIYGVIAQAVSQRTQEIGIRMALGARGSEVAWLAVRQGLAPVVVGMAAGAALALALGRAMTAMLYGVEASDAATFAGVAAVMGAAGLLAAFWPARRAAGLGVVEALRR